MGPMGPATAMGYPDGPVAPEDELPCPEVAEAVETPEEEAEEGLAGIAPPGWAWLDPELNESYELYELKELKVWMESREGSALNVPEMVAPGPRGENWGTTTEYEVPGPP